MIRSITITDTPDYTQRTGDEIIGLAREQRIRVLSDFTTDDGEQRTLRFKARKRPLAFFLDDVLDMLPRFGFHATPTA